MSGRVAWGGWLILGLLACDCDAFSAEVYYDTARVVSVRPAYVTHKTRTAYCAQGLQPPGDVRRLNPSVGLAEVLHLASSAASRPVCEPVTERRVVGYDVTLRYGAQQWVRRMPRDPGRSVRVRVDVRPSLQPDRSRQRVTAN